MTPGNTSVDGGALTTLVACVAVIGANSLLLSPVAPAIAVDLGDSIVRIMYASTAYGIGTAISAFYLARHIDRIGIVRGLLLALGLLTLTLLSSALAPSVGWLIAAQFVAGLAAGIGLPAIYSMAAVIAPAGRENSILGVVLTGWTLSLVGGAALSALVADVLHWRAVYGGLALCCLVAAISSLAMRRFDTPSSNVATSTAAVLKLPGVLPLLVICFAYMAAFYGCYGFIGDHLVSALGYPVRATALIAISYGAGFGIAVVADPLIDRFGPRRLMPASFVFIGLVYALLFRLSGSYAVIITLSFAWGVANHFGLNLIVAGLSAADKTRRGAILGLNSGVTYIAMATGTYLYGLVYEQTGFPALALISSTLCLAAALICVIWISAVRSRQAS